MAGSVYTYNPAEVAVIVGGVALSGFAEDSIVSVSRDVQAYEKVTGADGRTSRARNPNKAGTITISLQHSSPSNDVLQAVALLDEASDAGVVPVIVRDGSGTSVHFTASAWVQKVPDSVRGTGISTVEWVLDCAEIDMFVGGNTEQRGANIE